LATTTVLACRWQVEADPASSPPRSKSVARTASATPSIPRSVPRPAAPPSAPRSTPTLVDVSHAARLHRRAGWTSRAVETSCVVQHATALRATHDVWPFRGELGVLGPASSRTPSRRSRRVSCSSHALACLKPARSFCRPSADAHGLRVSTYGLHVVVLRPLGAVRAHDRLIVGMLEHDVHEPG